MTVYIKEEKQAYNIQANKELECFSPVEIVAINGEIYHGIVIEEGMVMSVKTVTKTALFFTSKHKAEVKRNENV